MEYYETPPSEHRSALDTKQLSMWQLGTRTDRDEVLREVFQLFIKQENFQECGYHVTAQLTVLKLRNSTCVYPAH
jgi:hypothetical protein